MYELINGDCLEILKKINTNIHLTFLDPPFNQGKKYDNHNDNMPDEEYWGWMEEICRKVYEVTVPGGSIYFMQREKNAERVLACLRTSGWVYQNMIIWRKKTSAVPSSVRFGKSYQILVFATRGERPRVYHRLRVNPPMPPGYRIPREGVLVTDVWDDIRELTSGYLAGPEALRDEAGKRLHEQQAPLHLLRRILLASSLPTDTVLDPFGGSGTTAVVAEQLKRNSILIEKSPLYFHLIEQRLKTPRKADDISRYFEYYALTEHLSKIWGRR